ncbi:MAG: OmpA family protein [Bacteroidetes bacterium]|nr:OmpA family protein [Bacteroidota bacterium]
MKKQVILVVACFLMVMGPSVLAQVSLERQGDKAYAVHNFARAGRLYEAAFRKTDATTKRMELAMKVASSYHRMNQFSKALQWYEDALGEERKDVEVLIWAADAAMRMGQSAKAQAFLDRALEINPLHQRAGQLKEALAKYTAHAGIPHAGLELREAPEGINSSFSDYAPRWLGNELVISSMRPAQSLVPSYDGRTMQDYSRLYLFISRADGSYGEAITLPVQQNRNVATFAWDPGRKRVFFTSCNNRRQRCTILQSDFDPVTFIFSRPRQPEFVNKKFLYGHPFVAEDGKVLYFAAKLPGGYGGNDIYSVSIKPDGSFGLPVNAGPNVNTSGEELFPAMMGDSLLVFTSNGHPGYGGLDLYASAISGAGHGRAQLLPPPLNTTADDLALSFGPGGKTGAFSSNRAGQGADDIFFFHGCLLPVLVKGRVADAVSGKPLAGAEVMIQSQTSGMQLISDDQGIFQLYHCSPARLNLKAQAAGYRQAEVGLQLNVPGRTEEVMIRLNPVAAHASLSGTVVHRETRRPIAAQPVRLVRPGMPERTAITDAQGYYVFDTVPVNRIYTLKVERQGFFNESRVVNVPETGQKLMLNRQNGYDLDFELTPVVLKKEIVINNIYYDFDKATLRESSKMELGKLVSLMRDNPAMRIQISSHTDERGRADYNERLSAMRAQAVVDYLIQSGISPSRLTAQGYGKRFPVIKNARTEEEHQQNRRTTFQVLDLNAPIQVPVSQRVSTQPKSTRLVYRVQFLITSVRRNPEVDFAAIAALASGLRIFEEEDGLLYRYEAGERYTLPEAEALRNQIRAAGFPDSFVVPYIDNKRVTMQQARQFKP